MRRILAILALFVFSGSAVAGDATVAVVLKQAVIEYHVESNRAMQRYRGRLAVLDRQLTRTPNEEKVRLALLDVISSVRSQLRVHFRERLFPPGRRQD
jgi:hypothetical protein